MAAPAMKGSQYLQVGPRQGVHCRPTVVLSTWPSGGYQQQMISSQSLQHAAGHVRWRSSQFRSPDHNYRLRARVDPPPDNIPQIPGQIIERPPSAVSQETNSKPSRRMHVSHSSCNLHSTSATSSGVIRQPHTQQQCGRLARPSSGTRFEDRHKKSSTAPVFSIQACTVTIQSRPVARSVSTPRKIAPPKEPFPYPDPVHVGGNHAFNIRLTELTGLQRDTVKYEECRARIARRNATATTSSSASSLQANNRQPSRPSSSLSRPSVSNRSGTHRRISLPAQTMQDKSSLLQCSMTSRQLSLPAKMPSTQSNSTLSSELESSTLLEHGSVEEHADAKSTGKGNNSLPSSNDIVKEHKTEYSPVTDTTPEKVSTEGRNNKTEEYVDVQSSCVVPSVVTPKRHHREIVETIFSGEHQRKQMPKKQCKKRQTNACAKCVHGADEVDLTDTSTLCHDDIKLKDDVGIIERNNESLNSVEINSTTKVPTSPIKKSPRHHINRKSKTLSHNSTTPVETATASPQVPSPNEASSHSSTSSCSLTSEQSRHSSPTRHQTKISRTKLSKRRKHSRKAGKHKH